MNVEKTKDSLNKRFIEQQYQHNYEQLITLKKQPEPLAGVEYELNNFLKMVDGLRKTKAVAMPELSDAMEIAYRRLTGGNQKQFHDYTNDLYARHSIPLKLLGGALLALGAALVASAVLFAPAVITAASTGLATVYLATAGVTAVSSALSIGGTACFFAKTQQMRLAAAEKKLDNDKLDSNHYDSRTMYVAV